MGIGSTILKHKDLIGSTILKHKDLIGSIASAVRNVANTIKSVKDAQKESRKLQAIKKLVRAPPPRASGSCSTAPSEL